MDRIRNLAAAVLIQAAKDYLSVRKDSQKNTILKELRSPWVDFLTEGKSILLAKKLVEEPKEVKESLRYKS